MSEKLTKEEYSIINHTLTRSANKLYCCPEKEVSILLGKNLMEFAGVVPFVPDPYWRVTKKGEEAYNQELERRLGQESDYT